MPDRHATDTAELALTEPHPAPIFDTGPHPAPLSGPATAAWSIDDDEDGTGDDAVGAQGREATPAAVEPPATPAAALRPDAPAPPVVVPGQYHFLSWWKLALMLLAVWIPAAGAGLALFSWWFALADKTPAVFVVLVYTVVTMVAGIILAMVVDKPLVSAVAIGLLSAVFISGAAAAPLYGYHFCHHVERCLGGILPY